MEGAEGKPAALYLEDLWVGRRFRSPERKISSEQIIEFARQFDPQPFHTDPDTAKATFFGGLVASGWHTAALTMRMLTECGLDIAGGMIGASVEINWPIPTAPESVLHVEVEVLETRRSKSRPDKGLASVRVHTVNQAGENVQVLTAKLLVPSLPPGTSR